MLLLVPLAVGAYLLVVQMGNGPSSPAYTRAETNALSAVAATNFQGADTSLQAWFAEHTTYAGAAAPAESGVTLVRADATSYCLQTTATPVEHEVGPGGQPQAGPCM